MSEKICGECAWRLYDYDDCEWICANTFSKNCGRPMSIMATACDCYENTGDYLKEEL